MRLSLFLVCLLLFVVVGCTGESDSSVTGQAIGAPYIGYTTFINDAFSFSFNYPESWSPRAQDLPGNWAATDGQGNTLLFTVAPARVDDLTVLGQTQALRDSVPQGATSVQASQLHAIGKTVKIVNFGAFEWYTYALGFGDNGATSMVSGTVCDDNEIVLVMVTRDEDIEENRRVYTDVLESFRC